MIRKTIIYGLAILAIAAAALWWKGAPLRADRTVAGILFAFAAGAAMWLRWDWAPARRRGGRKW